MKRRHIPWGATLFTLMSALILCSLGGWQIQRLQWKTALLSSLAQEYQKDPSDTPLDATDFLTMTKNDVRRGFVTGHFLLDKQIAIGPRLHEEISGYEIYTPLMLETGEILLTHQGWHKEKKMNLAEDRMSLIGMARTPSKPWKLGIHNDPKTDMWVYLNMEDIAQIVPDLLPVIFDVGEEEQQWMPNNNHLHYALFWFALCGIMLLVYYGRFWRS